MLRKRKQLTFLSIEQKHDINMRLARGESINSVAERYGVSRALVFLVRQNRESIAKCVADKAAQAAHRSTQRSRLFVHIEEKLYDWYVQRKLLGGVPVSDETLVDRALFIHRQQVRYNGGRENSKPFKASENWLKSFKEKYNVDVHANCDVVDEPAEEDVPPETWTVGEFAEKVKRLGLKAQQVYVAEPSRMQWSSLPGDRRLSGGGTGDGGGGGGGEKSSSDWLTYVSCANVSGTHKLDLLVIVGGQGSSAGDVLDVRGARLPVRAVYEDNVDKDGNPMTVARAFRQWFSDHFVPSVRHFHRVTPTPRTVLLAVTDVNFVAYRDRMEFFGRQATRVGVHVAFVVLTGDLKVARNLQTEYRSLLLSLALQYDRTSVRDVVRLLARAWKSMSNEAILCVWRWSWADVNAHAAARMYDERCGDGLAEKEILRWLQEPLLDDRGPPPGIPIYSDDDMIDYYDGDESRTSAEGEETMVVPKSEDATSKTAVDSFDECITWAVENGISVQNLQVLKKLRNKASEKQHQIMFNTI